MYERTISLNHHQGDDSAVALVVTYVPTRLIQAEAELRSSAHCFIGTSTISTRRFWA